MAWRLPFADHCNKTRYGSSPPLAAWAVGHSVKEQTQFRGLGYNRTEGINGRTTAIGNSGGTRLRHPDLCPRELVHHFRAAYVFPRDANLAPTSRLEPRAILDSGSRGQLPFLWLRC